LYIVGVIHSEGIEASTPRDILESQEAPDIHDDLAAAFGRILSWLFQARTWEKRNGRKCRSVEHVGFRAFVLAYKIRPDLIDGMTFAEIGELLGQGRSHAHNLSQELTLTFGIRGRNEQVTEAKKRRQREWARTHPTSQREDLTSAHLPLVNRFAQWQATLERAGMDVTDPQHAARLRKDFAPLLRFAQRIAPSTQATGPR
jgi:hypothetical protein